MWPDRPEEGVVGDPLHARVDRGGAVLGPVRSGTGGAQLSARRSTTG